MARMLVQSAHFVSPRERRSAFSFASFNTTSARLSIVVAVVLLGAAYLWIMNSATAAGFQLTKLEKHRVALESEYGRLQEQEVALRSLNHISQESADMNMVAQVTPSYVDRTEKAVARR
ncbi:MAG: hypothetical protein KIH62_004500 [Candidatus Kerfeldbacteria bacterium]|nr:hypothetical protein [Candidatus Kerfeldbacteria bacterium]